MTGFFTLHRRVFKHHIVGKKHPEQFMAWCWMLGQAAFKDTKHDINGKTVVIKRGQFSCSTRKMAEELDWSEARVRRFLKRLKIDAMIDADSDAGRNVITICKYEQYQNCATESDAASDAQSDAGATQERRTKEQPNQFTNTSDEVLEPGGSSDPPERFNPNLVFFGKQPGSALRYLTDNGVPDRQARSMLGKWRKNFGDEEVVAAIGQASSVTASEPIPYITQILNNGNRAHDKPSRSHGFNQQTASKAAMLATIAGHAPPESPGYRQGPDLEAGLGAAGVIEH